jgi:hypothetical protein
MSIPSNGITPEVIRGVMAPYHLSLDLLHATFAALPAPPRDATPPPTQPDPTPTIPTLPVRQDRAAPGPHPQPDQPPQPDHADGIPEWTRTKLDEGPGWSREVLRHRSNNTGGNGTAPGSPT